MTEIDFIQLVAARKEFNKLRCARNINRRQIILRAVEPRNISVNRNLFPHARKIDLPTEVRDRLVFVAGSVIVQVDPDIAHFLFVSIDDKCPFIEIFARSEYYFGLIRRVAFRLALIREGRRTKSCAQHQPGGEM